MAGVHETRRTVPTSGWATASLICGIAGLLVGCCTCGLPNLAAVILGHLAWRETRSGLRRGHGMTVAGLILGYALLVPSMLVTLWLATRDSYPTSP